MSKTTKKKVTKKVAKKSLEKKKVVSKKQSNEIVIRVAQPSVEEVTKPILENNKYVIAPSWVAEKQIMYLVGKTPAQHIYTRPAKGGGVWHYVTGQYIEKVLNYVFAWNWDFDVVAHGVEGNQVWVKGKLTVKNDKGLSISKTQFGRADVKFKRGSKDMLDFGNDLKAATTDALKKCASLLGIASDVHGKTEYKEETGRAPKETDPENDFNQDTAPANESQEEFEDHICTEEGCGKDLTEQEAGFSKRVYGKELCREHQQGAKRV